METRLARLDNSGVVLQWFTDRSGHVRFAGDHVGFEILDVCHPVVLIDASHGMVQERKLVSAKQSVAIPSSIVGGYSFTSCVYM